MQREKRKDVEFFRAEEIGKGLSFAVTDYESFGEGGDILIPSVRDFHVIFWIKKGRSKYVVDFTEYDLEPDTLILLSKNQLNYFLPYPLADTEFQSITFSPEFIYRTESDLQHLFRFVSTSHEKGRQILKIPAKKNDRIEMMFSEMKMVYTNHDSEHQSKAFYHWLCLLLIECEEMYGAQSEISNLNEDSKTALAFKELVEEYFKTEFKVEFYSDNLNIPSKRLSEITKAYFKRSPKGVIDERRILEIKRRLRGTDQTGKTIAYDLNFDEPSNLYKYFKKHVGLTPNEFRGQS